MMLFIPLQLISFEFPSDIISFQTEEYPIDFLVVWIGQYLYTFSFCLHSWRVFLLDTEFWVKSFYYF